MMLPVQISYRNVQPSEAVEARIREEAAQLEKVYDRIVSCRVAVEALHHRLDRGNPYHIRIDLKVPGTELVLKQEPSLHKPNQQVNEERIPKEVLMEGPHKDIYVAIRDAFDAMRRELEDFAGRQRGDVKHHEPVPHARVSKLFPQEDYGFLETFDGREIYFHRNAVLDNAFDRLEIGKEVAFAEEMGEKGPQASTVKLVGKHHPDVKHRPHL
jgi:cold shock CspA family protein/ribosome-associated translation inhibitor RaiA